MIKEYSYGAVIYKKESNKLLYLIEHMSLGHISLPKGHIEKNETIEECVKREMYEELKIDVTIDYKESKTITYSPKENVIKDVTFFIGVSNTKDITVDNFEVINASYYNFNDALNLLTFNKDKEVLTWANEILEKL